MPQDTTKSVYPTSLTGQCRRAAAVTPSDTQDLTNYAKALLIGGAGTLKVIPVGNADDAPITVDVTAGQVFSFCQVRRVFATGTSATSIIAGFD